MTALETLAVRRLVPDRRDPVEARLRRLARDLERGKNS